MKEKESVLRSIDWLTILLYLILLALGWVSICGASYSFDNPNLFSLSTRSGMELVWIGVSISVGTVLLLLDGRMYETFAYALCGFMLVVLFLMIFNPADTKGSHSFISIGSQKIQPAEFGKFAVALGLAKLMASYKFSVRNWQDLGKAIGLILLPMVFIVLQKETGSALVYGAFFLMLYREGMTGSFLFTGVAMVLYFVIGIRFAEPLVWETPAHIGPFAVLLMIQCFTSALVLVYCRAKNEAGILLLVSTVTTLVALLFSKFVIPFDVLWVQVLLVAGTIGFLLWKSYERQMRHYLFVALFTLGSVAFFFSASYVLNHVMEEHQRVRINVLLGLKEDLAGAGYNVHQSQIAIGSGALQGKGFLNGTQTKLKFVPEQETDFIFCTVGEEWGFAGTTTVLILFLFLIWRLIYVAERQPYIFGRVYGYCVVSVFLFHVFINIGMVLGLTPVIGIPLPFFSYGGSSLLSFTILLFIFLRIDAGRKLALNR